MLEVWRRGKRRRIVIECIGKPLAHQFSDASDAGLRIEFAEGAPDCRICRPGVMEVKRFAVMG